LKVQNGREKLAMLTLMAGVCGSSPALFSTKACGKAMIHSGSPSNSPLRTIAAQTMWVPLASSGASRS